MQRSLLQNYRSAIQCWCKLVFHSGWIGQSHGGKEVLPLQVTACIVFVPVMDIDGFKVISHEDAMDIQVPNWWRWRTLKLLHFRTNCDQLEKVKVTQFVWYHWTTETICSQTTQD